MTPARRRPGRGDLVVVSCYCTQPENPLPNSYVECVQGWMGWMDSWMGGWVAGQEGGYRDNAVIVDQAGKACCHVEEKSFRPFQIVFQEKL
jgi:hypothetical protein